MDFVGNVCNRAFVYLKMGAMRLMHSSYVISALEYFMIIAHIGGGHGPLAPHSPADLDHAAPFGLNWNGWTLAFPALCADLAKPIPASRDLPDGPAP